ncbi:MAG TPA: AI-2E family transporter [Ktedonobacterales bacterium]
MATERATERATGPSVTSDGDAKPARAGISLKSPLSLPVKATAQVVAKHKAAQADADLQWVRRRNIAFTILCWVGIAGVVIWLASQIYHALIVLVMAAVLAYALFPAVSLLCRWVPRWLAVLLVYLALFAIVGGFGYLLVSTAVASVREHERQILGAFAPDGALNGIVNQLVSLGIPREQIDAVTKSLADKLSSQASNVPQALGAFFNGLLDTVLVVVVSIYLLVDGERLALWANTRTPLRYRKRVQTFLSGLQRVVGGYIRGELSLALLIGTMVGAGMFVLQVPFALLLGVMAFALEFIPIVGTLISGAICVSVALTQGWLLALAVLAYFVVVHVIEGDVVGPRLLGRAIGLHPVVSIIALVAGAERFSVWGAVFAAPLAGLAQGIIIDIWQEWRKSHAEEFAEELEEGVGDSDADELPVVALVDSAVGSILLNDPPLDGTDVAEEAAAHDDLHAVERGLASGPAIGPGVSPG